MSVSAYPLAWPEGWPRTPSSRQQDSKYRFKRTGRSQPFWTFAEARDELSNELDRMGARNVVLSSNYELRLDGLPRGNGARPTDTGVAVYFTLKGVQKVMACDMHIRAEENMRSIALALDAMRALERHGGRHYDGTGIRGLHSPASARRKAVMARGSRLPADRPSRPLRNRSALPQSRSREPTIRACIYRQVFSPFDHATHRAHSPVPR